jgi:hypothetical protein
LSIQFFIQPAPGKTLGPLSDDALRDALRAGEHPASVRTREVETTLWLPAAAWATLATPAPPLTPPPSARESEAGSASPDLMLAPVETLDRLRFVVAEQGQSFGPVLGEKLREGVNLGKYRQAWVAPLGTEDWVLARKLFDRTLTEGARAVLLESAPDLKTVRCPTCRELVAESSSVCPECDEPISPASAPASRGSIPDDPEDASWLRMHWRPVVTFGAITSLLLSGITLRYLAPGRFSAADQPHASPMEPPAASQPCEAKCWNGESCQANSCVWQAPADVSHVSPRPGVAGPFALPPDVGDAVLLDDARFAIGLFAGTEIRSARTGQSLGLVTQAAHTQKLLRTERSLYAVGPQHVAVIDLETLRHEKTLELGGITGEVSLGSSGRQVFVSLPGLHQVSILSTDLHVELERIRFGDDPVGRIASDDAGKRALAATGMLPVPGQRDSAGGAVYAFDPSRLATRQDRVRASIVGNPTSVLVTPDGERGIALLRRDNKLVPMEILPTGAVRLAEPVDTCDQPEQIELVRRARLAVVRCNRGRAVEIFSLDDASLVRRVPFGDPVLDLAVTPDGEQIVVAVAGASGGAVGLVDLESFSVEMVPLTEPPTRIDVSPRGDTVLALSDRSKVAWVIR